MPKSGLGLRRTSAVQEDYLKALHHLGAGAASVVVSTSELAEELGVNPGSVSEMLSKLASLGLVTHDPYRGARLSPEGLAIAVEIIRHHRIIETYLVRALGYHWDEVHEEADRLEHAISEVLEERMWQALGQPEFDPHGDPIPTLDGRVAERPSRPLHLVPAGSEVRIGRISDRDSEKLRAIERLGLVPGAEIELLEESTWEGPLLVVADGVQVSVPLGLARAIFVEGPWRA